MVLRACLPALQRSWRKDAPVSSSLPGCLRAHPHFSVLMLAPAVPLLEGIRRAVAVSVDARGLVCGTGRSHQLGTQANSFAVSVTIKWLLPWNMLGFLSKLAGLGL